MSSQPWFLHFLGKLSPTFHRFHLVSDPICCMIGNLLFWCPYCTPSVTTIAVPLPLCQAAEQFMRHRLVPPIVSEILCKTAGANEVQIYLQKS